MVAIWARAARAAIVEVRGGGRVLRRRVELADGGSGALDVGGLAPATEHEVTVTVDDVELAPCRARTAPVTGDPRPVRLAIAADFDPHPAFDSDLADHVATAAPDLLVTIGDCPYTDNGPPAQTLAEYRDRHALLRTHPRARRLLDAMAVRAIYDDHEFRNDWDAAFVAAEPERYRAAMTAWDEFFPLRGATGAVRYRSWRQGAHLECFLLDCRRFRSANAATDDDAKTMLGAAQLRWLVDGLSASAATFKLVFTSVPLDLAGADAWSGFLQERARLFAAVLDVPGVLFVSGDQHYFASRRHAFGIRELQVGPFARGLGALPELAPGTLYQDARYNVALVDVDGDRLRLTGLGAGGERFHQESLTAADLTPRRSG
jgi:alkaline phosphatase D